MNKLFQKTYKSLICQTYSSFRQAKVGPDLLLLKYDLIKHNKEIYQAVLQHKHIKIQTNNFVIEVVPDQYNNADDYESQIYFYQTGNDTYFLFADLTVDPNHYHDNIIFSNLYYAFQGYIQNMLEYYQRMQKEFLE